MEDDSGTFYRPKDVPDEVPNGEAKIGRVLEMARKQRGLTL
jgi:hypothetical protein